MPTCRQCRQPVSEGDVVTHEETGARYHELVVVGDLIGFGSGAGVEPYRCGPVRE